MYKLCQYMSVSNIYVLQTVILSEQTSLIDRQVLQINRSSNLGVCERQLCSIDCQLWYISVYVLSVPVCVDWYRYLPLQTEEENRQRGKHSLFSGWCGFGGAKSGEVYIDEQGRGEPHCGVQALLMRRTRYSQPQCTVLTRQGSLTGYSQPQCTVMVSASMVLQMETEVLAYSQLKVQWSLLPFVHHVYVDREACPKGTQACLSWNIRFFVTNVFCEVPSS